MALTQKEVKNWQKVAEHGD